GTRRVVGVSYRSFWRPRLAIDFVLGTGKASGGEMRKLIGHFTWASLLRREALSIVDACCSFAETHLNAVTRQWPAVCRELRWIRDLLPMLSHSARMLWSELVHVSDASTEGFGVCRARWSVPDAALVGRCDERWRFRAEEATNARGHALRPDVLALGLDDLRLNPSVRSATDAEPWEGAPLDEVPATAVANAPWKLCALGRWREEGGIMGVECRALFMAVRHLLRFQSHHCRHALFRVDNLALALSLAKGRARSRRLFPACREVAALLLFGGCRFHVRRVPSELNPAGAPSRGRRAPSRIDFERLAEAYQDLRERRAGAGGGSLRRELDLAALHALGSNSDDEVGSGGDCAPSPGDLAPLDPEGARGFERAEDIWQQGEPPGLEAARGAGRFALGAPIALPLQQSGLRLSPVRPSSLEDHRRRLGWSKECVDRPGEEPEQLSFDEAVSLWFGGFHQKDQSADDGPKFLAVLQRQRPELRAQEQLPRAPRPLGGLRGLLDGLRWLGHFEGAVGVLVAFMGYLRPGELLPGLSAMSIVSPVLGAGRLPRWALVLSACELKYRSKTDVFDEIVVLDRRGYKRL
ncbi:unnamed protein product, partial [Prorocentrum cordatum]